MFTGDPNQRGIAIAAAMPLRDLSIIGWGSHPLSIEEILGEANVQVAWVF